MNAPMPPQLMKFRRNRQLDNYAERGGTCRVWRSSVLNWFLVPRDFTQLYKIAVLTPS